MQTLAPVVEPGDIQNRPWATAETTYRPLAFTDDVGDRWLNGVKYVPRGCPEINAATDSDCVEVVFEAGDGFDAVEAFYPFRIDLAVKCTTIGGMSAAEMRQRAEAELRVAASAVIARQVWQRTFNPANPSLRSVADDVSTSDTSVVGALANVEDGLAQKLLNGLGMVHMTVGTFVRLRSAGAVIMVDGGWVTPSGHQVVADAGYDGSAPGGLAAGQAWIYGSGDVRYRTTDLNPLGEDWENIDWTRNIQTVRAYQYALATFETCPVVAARSDAPTVPDMAGGL